MCDDWSLHLKADQFDSGVITVAPSLFKRHLSSHQEQLALFSITPNFDRELDSENGSQKSGMSKQHRQENLLQWQNSAQSLSEGEENHDAEFRLENLIELYSANELALELFVESLQTLASEHPEMTQTITDIIHAETADGQISSRISSPDTGATFPMSVEQQVQIDNSENQLAESVVHEYTYPLERRSNENDAPVESLGVREMALAEAVLAKFASNVIKKKSLGTRDHHLTPRIREQHENEGNANVSPTVRRRQLGNVVFTNVSPTVRQRRLANVVLTKFSENVRSKKLRAEALENKLSPSSRHLPAGKLEDHRSILDAYSHKLQAARTQLDQLIEGHSHDNLYTNGRLVRALRQAENADNYDASGSIQDALEAYSNACALLHAIMPDVASHERRLLGSINSTFSERAEVLRQIIGSVSRDERTDDTANYRCICGENTTLSDRTLTSCDQCGVFQHCVCMGVPIVETETPKNYWCEQCAPGDHTETVQALERGIDIWRTRNYLYNVGKDSTTTHPLLQNYKRNVDAVESLTSGLRQLEQDFVNEEENRIDKQRMGEVLEEPEEDFWKRY